MWAAKHIFCQESEVDFSSLSCHRNKGEFGHAEQRSGEEEGAEWMEGKKKKKKKKTRKFMKLWRLFVRRSFVRALLVFPPEESSTTESRRTELDEGLTKVSCNPCVV